MTLIARSQSIAPEGQLVYHIAHSSDRDSIAEHGLLPRHPDGHSGAEQWGNPPGVYVFDRESIAFQIDAHGRHYDVWSIAIKSMDLTQDASIENAWFQVGAVAPNSLQLVEHGYSERDHRRW